MSAEQIVESTPAIGVVKHVPNHPLSPLTASEITRSAELIRTLYPSETNLQFKAITLEEPEKAQLVPFLEAEHCGTNTPHIDRKAFVNYYIRNTVCSNPFGCNPLRLYSLLRPDSLIVPQDKFHEAIINLTHQHVESHFRLGPNIHSPGDGEELILIEKVALEDAGVKAEIAKLQLPEGTVVIIDPWIYGMNAI